jgi:integrase
MCSIPFCNATNSRRSPSGRPSPNHAERALSKLLRTVDEGEHVDPSRITVREWLELWVATTRAEVAPKTHERYAEIVRCYLIPSLGGLRLHRLSPADIQRAYNEFPRDPAPRTRRHIHRILKSALKRAVEQQALARNPADAITRLPKVERQPVTVLTVAEASRLLKAISHTTTYWPVLLALATGMRRGEIQALRWKNLDLDRGVVQVVESLEQTRQGGLRFKSTKTEKARAVTLPRFAQEELRRWKAAQAGALLTLGVKQEAKTLVCARQDGEPKQPESLTHDRGAEGPLPRPPALPCNAATRERGASQDRSGTPRPLHDHGDDGPLLPRLRDHARRRSGPAGCCLRRAVMVTKMVTNSKLPASPSGDGSGRRGRIPKSFQHHRGSNRIGTDGRRRISRPVP